MSKISVTTIAGLTSGGDANKVKIDSSNTLHVPGHASIGVDAVAGTRALTVAGATDGGSSEILNCYNSSLASKFSVRDDGLVSVTGTLTSSGLITASSGVAIGGTGAANTLDDYEEGTFTPSFTLGITSPVYQYQTGRYTKIGRMVYIETDIRLTGGSGNSSQVVLGGLPFTSNSASPYSALYFQYNGSWNNISYPSLFLVVAGSTTANYYKSTDGGAIVGTAITNWTNTTVRIGGWYTT